MAEEEQENQEPPKKKGKLVFIIVGVVVVLGVGAGGVFLGPKIMPAKAEVAAEPAPSAQEAKISSTAKFHPIVVDVRGEEGSVHHMKVVLSFELADGVSEEEFKKFAPRGREAAISYLRAQTFEFVTDPKNFEKVTAELTKRATEGIGAKRVERALITDFVSQ